MSDAEVTAIAFEPVESVEMTQNGPNTLPICVTVYVCARFPVPPLAFVSRAYGTFKLKLRHLNTNSSLPAKSRYQCSTAAPPRNEIRRGAPGRSSAAAEASGTTKFRHIHSVGRHS